MMAHPDTLAEALSSTPEMREAVCLAALGLGGVIPADRSPDYAISAVAMLLDHSASQDEPSGWVATALRAFLLEIARGDLTEASQACFDELAASIGPACEHLAALHFDEEAVSGLASLKELVSILRDPAETRDAQHVIDACDGHLDAIALAANTLDAAYRRQRLHQRTAAAHHAPQALQEANHAA